MADEKNDLHYRQHGDKDSIQKLRQFYVERQLTLEKEWEAPTYTYSWRNPIGFYGHQKVRHHLIEMLNKHSLFLAEKRVLDIGCGYGSWLCFFAEFRGNSLGLVGLDISAHRISRAKAINPGIEFITGNAVSLPFSNEPFDIVTQFDTFEHFLDKPNLRKAAQELTRVLKKNGFLLWFDLLPFLPRSDLVRGYSVKEVKALLPQFELIDYKPIFKKFNLGFMTLSTAYALPRFSFMLADLAQKIPFGRCTNLMVLMRKRD